MVPEGAQGFAEPKGMCNGACTSTVSPVGGMARVHFREPVRREIPSVNGFLIGFPMVGTVRYFKGFCKCLYPLVLSKRVI